MIWYMWFFPTLGDTYQIDGFSTQNNNKTVIVKTDAEIMFPDNLNRKQKEELVNNTLRNTRGTASYLVRKQFMFQWVRHLSPCLQFVVIATDQC